VVGATKAGIDDQVQKIVGPFPTGGTFEDGFIQSPAAVDDAVAGEVAEGGFGVEHVF
jgi:hypothetical protein